MSGLNPTMAGAAHTLHRGRTYFDALWNPVGDAASSEWDRLGWPLSCRGRQRIRVETVPELFDDSRPDATLDLVHAVIAVAHRHHFLLATERVERMIAYYTDAETPRRIAEEVGALSFAVLANDRRKVPQDWIAGFSRVRYGLRRGERGGIGPVGLEPWPLVNLWVGFPDGAVRRVVPLSGLLEFLGDPAPDRPSDRAGLAQTRGYFGNSRR
jgi:hypothetical protein